MLKFKMREVDQAIKNCILEDYMTAKEISEQLSLPYVRVSNRIRKMRKNGEIMCIRAVDKPGQGVKPMKYILCPS